MLPASFGKAKGRKDQRKAHVKPQQLCSHPGGIQTDPTWYLGTSWSLCLELWNLFEPSLGTPTWNLGTFTWNPSWNFETLRNLSCTWNPFWNPFFLEPGNLLGPLLGTLTRNLAALPQGLAPKLSFSWEK